MLLGLKLEHFQVLELLMMRDYETIGAVTGGSKQTFSGLSIDVVTGDFIGCFYATGLIERSTSGYTAIYRAGGDKFGTGSASYNLLAGDAISLYATGETAGGYAGKLYGVSISKAFGAEVAKVNGV